VVGAIVIGVWAVIFLTSFSTGIVREYIRNAIENEISHIQIHQENYLLDRDPELHISEVNEMMEFIGEVPHIRGYASRTMVYGMVSSAKGARGMRIKGIDPDLEASVTTLGDKIVEGTYFVEDKKNQILVSTSIAEKQNLKLRSKVILTFQDLEGEITAGAFRIIGLFDTGSTPYDESSVFVRKADLNRLLSHDDLAHEIAILADSPVHVDSIMTTIKQRFPSYSIHDYKTISPDIELYESQIQLSSLIFTIIVMLALIFGIINTMLMAVLERYRELGMLMAVGMNKTRVFLMIVLETIALCVVGMPVGILLGLLTVNYLGKTGIDLSNYSKGMKEFGMSDYIYPELDGYMYFLLALIVVITALLASIYPAMKAIKLRPVEAIRKI
jgi:ABC-type lipoprotein release transport system permease subunit